MSGRFFTTKHTTYTKVGDRPTEDTDGAERLGKVARERREGT